MFASLPLQNFKLTSAEIVPFLFYYALRLKVNFRDFVFICFFFLFLLRSLCANPAIWTNFNRLPSQTFGSERICTDPSYCPTFADKLLSMHKRIHTHTFKCDCMYACQIIYMYICMYGMCMHKSMNVRIVSWGIYIHIYIQIHILSQITSSLSCHRVVKKLHAHCMHTYTHSDTYTRVYSYVWEVLWHNANTIIYIPKYIHKTCKCICMHFRLRIYIHKYIYIHVLVNMLYTL